MSGGGGSRKVAAQKGNLVDLRGLSWADCKSSPPLAPDVVSQNSLRRGTGPHSPLGGSPRSTPRSRRTGRPGSRGVSGTGVGRTRVSRGTNGIRSLSPSLQYELGCPCPNPHFHRQRSTEVVPKRRKEDEDHRIQDGENYALTPDRTLPILRIHDNNT